jgi:hypothetical protein
MSTDRELLENAAKAAGIKVPTKEDYPYAYIDQHGIHRDISCGGDGSRMSHWNPLTDDGDALRLAVKLDLSSLVIFPSTGGKRREFWTPNSGYDNGNAATTEAEYAADPLAATRRAIVRAAAEIGRQMP